MNGIFYWDGFLFVVLEDIFFGIKIFFIEYDYIDVNDVFIVFLEGVIEWIVFGILSKGCVVFIYEVGSNSSSNDF